MGQSPTGLFWLKSRTLCTTVQFCSELSLRFWTFQKNQLVWVRGSDQQLLVLWTRTYLKSWLSSLSSNRIRRSNAQLACTRAPELQEARVVHAHVRARSQTLPPPSHLPERHADLWTRPSPQSPKASPSAVSKVLLWRSYCLTRVEPGKPCFDPVPGSSGAGRTGPSPKFCCRVSCWYQQKLCRREGLSGPPEQPRWF